MKISGKHKGHRPVPGYPSTANLAVLGALERDLEKFEEGTSKLGHHSPGPKGTTEVYRYLAYLWGTFGFLRKFYVSIFS